MDDDALALVFFHDLVLDHGVEGAQEFVVADEEMGFAAEMVEHACHFYGDVTCPYESDLVWSFLEVEEPIGGYAQVGAWDVWNVGVATGSEKNLLRSNGLFAAVIEDYLRFILREKMCTTMQPFHLVFVEILCVDVV